MSLVSDRQFRNAEEILRRRAHALKPTGDDGFEGFIRDLLEEALMTRFRLMKSGHQGGADIINQPYATGIAIGVEGKRYGARSRLSLDALKYKISEAAAAGSGLDLWVLATTSRMNGTDLRALTAEGRRQGISVAVIDSTIDGGGPSSLALLCAAAPDAFKRHIGDEPALDAYVTSLQADDDHKSKLRLLLDQFRRPDLGYESSREAAGAWLHQAFADKRSANARLHAFVDLEAPTTHRVTRVAIGSEIDKWWDDGAVAPLVLLGDEGLGKSWALFGWWLDRQRAEQDLPLTLIVPARAVNTASGPDLLVQLLSQRVPGREEDWRRRLTHWIEGDPAVPRILLIVDGLNQNDQYRDWTRLFQSLFAPPWRDRVAVAMTCRPDYWHEQLKGLANLDPLAGTIAVEPYSDAELAQVLARHALTLRDFGPEFGTVLRIPRYCQLAIERRDALRGSGDITVERLIYEDWKHRIRMRGCDLAISDDEFHDFIAEQGCNLQQAIASSAGAPMLSRSQIAERIGRDSGLSPSQLHATLSEITEGHWLDRSDCPPHHFRLRKEFVPFALGLALVRALARAPGEDALEDRLAQFFDPLRGTDQGVAILRAATAAAVLDQRIPGEVSRLIIRWWLESQNFSGIDAVALQRLMGEAPDIFLDVTEGLWLGHQAAFRNDAIIVRAIAHSYKWPQFATALRRRMVTWLGAFWPDEPIDRGGVPVSIGDVDELERRHRNWEQSVAAIERQRNLPIVRLSREEIELRDRDWLIGHAAGILSFLPRCDFADAMFTWAAARAIMRPKARPELLDWVLRQNRIDPRETEALILEQTEMLLAADLAADPGVAVQAALYLLDALATPKAAKLAAAHSEESQVRSRARETIRLDGSRVHWDYETALRWRGSRTCPLHATFGLADYAIDPDIELDEAGRAVLRDLAAGIDPGQFFRDRKSRSWSDFGLDSAVAPLARWVPDGFNNLHRHIMTSAADRGSDQGMALVREISGLSPILSAAERAALCKLADRMLPLGSTRAGVEQDRLRVQEARLIGQEAAVQIEILAAGPIVMLLPRHILSPPQPPDFERLADLLSQQQSPEQLRGWLDYLKSVSLRHMPDDFPPLIALLGHADKHVRADAFGVVRLAQKPGIFRWLASTWRRTGEMDPTDDFWGSFALCEASRTVEIPDILDRVSPKFFSYLAVIHPNNEAILNAYSDYIIGLVHDLPVRGQQDRCPLFRKDRPLRALLLWQPDAVIQAIDELISQAPEACLGIGAYPVISAIGVLLETDPAEGIRLWRNLYVHCAGAHRLDEFEQPPFFAGIHLPVRVLCAHLLECAETDADLAKFAGWAVEGGLGDWLVAQIQRLLGAPSAGDIARGLTLAGSLDSSQAANSLWSETLDKLELTGWLADRRAAAARRWRAGRFAEHWFQAFLDSPDAESGYPLFRLFLECADDLALSRAHAKTLSSRSPSHCAAIWDLNSDRRYEAKKAARDRSRFLYGSAISQRTHAPWIGDPTPIPSK